MVNKNSSFNIWIFWPQLLVPIMMHLTQAPPSMQLLAQINSTKFI